MSTTLSTQTSQTSPISQEKFGFRHRWSKCKKKKQAKIKIHYRCKMSLGYVLEKGVMVHLTHHKYQLSHVGPGEVVQQLPHRPDVLQHRHMEKKSYRYSFTFQLNNDNAAATGCKSESRAESSFNQCSAMLNWIPQDRVYVYCCSCSFENAIFFIF